MFPTPVAPSRAEVVAEARSWLYTPYQLGQMLKGAGVDCGLLPYAVYRKFNLVPEFTADRLLQMGNGDWWCHTNQDRYLLMVERYLRRLVEKGTTDARLPGNLALARTGHSRVYNHAGIITSWPRLIHAAYNRVTESSLQDPLWLGKTITIFDIGLPA